LNYVLSRCEKEKNRFENCLNIEDCEIPKRYKKDDFAMKKMSKMMKILYGNLNQGYWADMAEKQTC